MSTGIAQQPHHARLHRSEAGEVEADCGNRGEEEADEGGVVRLADDRPDPDAVMVHHVHHPAAHRGVARARDLPPLGPLAKVGGEARVRGEALERAEASTWISS